MRVLVQVGFKRTRKEGQKISARIVTANEQVGWTNYPGKRQTVCWHLCELELNTGDVLSVL